MKLALWPRVSFRRSFEYFRKRVLRLAGSPHAIAAGVAAGVFSAFTPFLGLHIVIALVIAFFVGGNFIAAALGTTVANPVTLPFIWASTYKLGHAMLGGGRFRTGGDLPRNFAEKSLHAIWPVIKPMLIGSIPLGIIAGLIFYVIVFYAARAFQAMRRERLAERRKAQGPKPAPGTAAEEMGDQA
jgi:uncharacterized protein (DUF2062 family)